ncbi:KilA-N domain-containing protein [Jejubacter calystegiae]|uniref:KilA-N domain-containing protein n=1 Tax=Jejubacter calystegiae TaxID=2579935 RepID=A0A4P8YPN8_9ENTR|nr:KilA-N domain-containing protein [Jejubacter calystegiae]QCT21744.1 KilA-N domain-containing protein [Jejubacter calystegiae]
MTSVNKKVLLNTQSRANSSESSFPIVISGISIRQDSEGRYSVNDLHKSAGGERRHEPKNWLNNQQTQELIEVIVNTGISVFSPITSKRGCKGGTYVCKELVYAYATWISAEFFLKVIRAYDALVSGDTEKAESIAKTTVDDRTPLRSLVNRIMGKYGVTYQAVYKMVHREFGVNHIDELSTKQTAEAMEYLSAKVIEGEFISKDSNEQPPKKQPDDSRYYVRVIIRDSLMGTAIELSGEADSLRDAANGIATDLGFKPHTFTHVPINKRVIRRLY